MEAVLVMKVLFITGYPVNSSISSGNTFINLFGGFPLSDSFHNINSRHGLVDKDFITTAISVTDNDIINSLIKRRQIKALYYPSDECEEMADKADNVTQLYKYKESKVLRYVGLFVRDILWSFGTWKQSVKDYIDQINPDIVFFAPSGVGYHHRILRYIHEISKVRIVLFHMDDHYTLKCLSLNPLYWLTRLKSRRWVRDSAKISSLQFAISELQCLEYTKMLKAPCTLLTKGHDFSGECPYRPGKTGDELILVYTGNVLYGRWKTLVYIGKFLDELYPEGEKAALEIYTGNTLTAEMEKAFSDVNSIRFMGSVPGYEVQAIQEKADILVHVESYKYVEKMYVRQSFSTKIIDYLHAGKCILVAGANDVASIKYFVDHDLGVVLSGDKDRDREMIEKIFDENERRGFANKAWDYGKQHHDINDIQKRLRDDLCELL